MNCHHIERLFDINYALLQYNRFIYVRVRTKDYKNFVRNKTEQKEVRRCEIFKLILQFVSFLFVLVFQSKKCHPKVTEKLCKFKCLSCTMTTKKKFTCEQFLVNVGRGRKMT